MMTVGRSPLDYSIRSIELSRRRRLARPDQSLIPDSVPLPRGAVLLETTTFADYHEFDSLQVVGVKRSGGLIVGFSSTSYELGFSPAIDVGKIYRESVERDFLTDEAGHFTTHATWIS
jgi:hypothetical protein